MLPGHHEPGSGCPCGNVTLFMIQSIHLQVAGKNVMARETWVGKIKNLVVTKENSATDWVIARTSNNSAPAWFALELSHRTPTSMAIYNQMRDAMRSGQSVRFIVQRDSSRPVWQQATILAVESPRLPFRMEFN